MMKNAHRWVPENRSPYLVAIAALAAAFLLRYALQGVLQGRLSIFFFEIASLLVCFYGGIWPGLLTLTVGLAIGTYFFAPPYRSFEPPQLIDIAVFTSFFVGTSIGLVVIEWLQRRTYEVRVLMLEVKYRNKMLEETIERMEQAEQAVRRYEAKVRVLASATPQLWSIARPDGEIEYVNARLYEITGMPAGSLEGEHWTGAVHPNDVELVRQISMQVEKTGLREEVGLRLLAADGKYHSFDAECSCLDGKQGKVIVWSGVASDIDGPA